MITSANKAEVIVGSDNYFHWEFVMLMTLARKGLLAHVQVVKDPAEVDEVWLLNDMKALGLIAQSVALEHHRKIRPVTSAIQAWNTLNDFYNRTGVHNRKLLKEYERQEKKEATEPALKAASHGGRGKNGRFDKGSKGYGRKINGGRRLGGVKGTCFNCGQVSHMKRDCPELANDVSVTDIVNGDANKGIANINQDLVFAVGKERSAGWLINSGATAHMTPRRGDMFEYKEMSVDMHVTIADGKKIRVTGAGMSVEFQSKARIIWDKSRAIASGKKIGKAYVLDFQENTAYYTEYLMVGSKGELWHARMGHLNEDSVAKTRQATHGIPTTQQNVENLCGGCIKRKQTSKGGARYVLTFADDCSQYVMAYFLTKKDEVSSKFESFVKLYENQWGRRIEYLRSDNGTEFSNKAMEKICQTNSILHQKTVLYSSQQNGVVERMNRTIMEKARSMLHYKGVSTAWWAEAVSTAVYLINRSTNSIHSTRTPFELTYKMKPSLDHLRVFGSIGYAHIDKSKRAKLEPKSFKGMLLGYSDDSKGYRVFDLGSNKAKVSTDAEDSVQVQQAQQPVGDMPKESQEEQTEDVEMQEVHPQQAPVQELVRARINNDLNNDDHFWPPFPKRPRIDEDSLLAEAVLTYAADVGDTNEAPTTYQQAMQSNEASEWIKAVNAELKAHADNSCMNSIRVVLSNSDLEEYVYMEVPCGIRDAGNMMCRLDKAIYGLKQAACGADERVYVKTYEGSFVYICLYMDDMTVAVKTGKEIQDVKLDQDYPSKTLMIKQTRYIDDVVELFNQKDAKIVVNPCESGLELTATQSPTAREERLKIPDVAYIVTQLSRFLEIPGIQHWKATIRVLCYLKAYTDADDRRSVSGTMVMISGALVVFKSQYQRTVAVSSAEAEYMALALCTQEVILKDIGYNARSKQVDIKHRFICENVSRNIVQHRKQLTKTHQKMIKQFRRRQEEEHVPERTEWASTIVRKLTVSSSMRALTRQSSPAVVLEVVACEMAMRVGDAEDERLVA
ncbi:Hypothetical protein PHPALM_14496 [Phytophthora palmivora]|uniref:Integrase catalytic core protein n=1 Tax=Phytophthora palmivora TaxID=4796 RepID=A0A2P4XUN9_9STRA|nr:Hypothetical protein PHPALM_14496 [Phytophthora palmivora]